MNNRRNFLRSTTALIALPFFESFGFRRFASAASPVAAPPKRMVFLGMGYGVTQETWFPDVNSTGKDYELPQGLQPLARHKDGFSIIQNLRHRYSSDGHSGSTFWLTGANRYAVAGQSFHNTISVDQVAAEQMGKDTRFTSIQFAAKSKANADGHGPGLSLAWNRYGKPVSALNTPVVAFHRLFSDDAMPLEQQQQQLAKQHSILDAVMSNAKSVERKLNRSDAVKLSEYLQSIREIEVRLSKEEKWLGVEKTKPTSKLSSPKQSLRGVEEIRMMYDLMVAAMQVDASRVFSYRMPVETMLQSLGSNMSAHNMSHYALGDRYTVSQTRDKHHSILLAEFFDKLKSVKETDGTSLFDNAAITFGSNIRTMHSLTNCPTMIAGGGAGFKQGRHIVMKDPKTPLCNLWLSTLRGCGIESESHGDSTGVIDELWS